MRVQRTYPERRTGLKSNRVMELTGSISTLGKDLEDLVLVLSFLDDILQTDESVLVCSVART